MNQTVALLMEDYSGASWDEEQVEHLANVLTQQADNLQACVSLRLILLIGVKQACRTCMDQAAGADFRWVLLTGS